MLTFELASGATTAATPIAITKKLSTNDNLVIKDNKIVFIVPGVYEIKGNVTLSTSTDGNFGISVQSDTKTLDYDTIANSSSTTTNVETVPVYHVINVVESDNNNNLELKVVPIGTVEVVNGLLTVSKIY